MACRLRYEGRFTSDKIISSRSRSRNTIETNLSPPTASFAINHDSGGQISQETLVPTPPLTEEGLPCMT